MSLTCRLLTEKEYKNISEKDLYLPIEQTYEWGQFQDGMKDRHFLGIYGIFEGKQCRAIANCVYIEMRGYNYIWAKQGPYIFEEHLNKEKQIIHILKKTLQMEIKQYPKPLFLRVHTKEKTGVPAFTNYIRHTLQIDLSLSENSILTQMKQKGRYNIRIAEKKGVQIEKYTYGDTEFDEALDAFYTLLEDTTKRDKFSHHPKKYYEEMLKTLKKYAILYMAKYQNEYIAGIIVTIYGRIAIYYYGASKDTYRNVMAPYLLQWTAIQDSKAKGASVYDFLGISEVEGDSLTGVTEFKRKFGGREVSYLKVYDVIWNPFQYYIIRLLKKIKTFIQ